MAGVAAQVSIRRLRAEDAELAIATFEMMAEVFEDPREPMSVAYVRRLLERDDFWVLAATAGARAIGGVTAHALPLTRVEGLELFIYDLAVHPDFQRRGVGRALMTELTTQAANAGIPVAWVPADNEDEHALEFYRSLGAAESPVTVFTLDSGA